MLLIESSACRILRAMALKANRSDNNKHKNHIFAKFTSKNYAKLC